MRTTRRNFVAFIGAFGILCAACSGSVAVEEGGSSESFEQQAVWAVFHADLEGLKQIAQSADLSLISGDEFSPGATLLHLAWDCDIAKFLIEEGVDPSQSNRVGLMPLHVAAERGWLDMIDCYHSLGISIHQLTEPSRLLPDLESLPEEADEFPDVYLGRGQGGLTALHIAAMASRPESAVAEIESRIERDGEDEDDATRLRIASRVAPVRDVIEGLVSLGIDPNVQGAFDLTPLHVAIVEGADESVETLLRLGASPDRLTTSGHSAHDLAIIELPTDWFGPRSESAMERIRQMLEHSAALGEHAGSTEWKLHPGGRASSRGWAV